MKLSTSLALMIERSDPNYLLGDGHLQVMRQCVQAGYELLDWNACDYARPGMQPGSTRLLRDDWRIFIKELRDQADQLGVRFNQAHGLMFNYFGQDEQTAYLHQMEERVMLACAELGVERIVYHPAVPDQCRESQDIEGCKRANQDYISRAAEQAGRLGLQIAVENMFITRNPDGTLIWRYCSYPEDLVDLVDSIGMANVQICFDVGHARMMDENIRSSVAFYGRRLAALHIQDNDGASDQHLLPFHGTVDWEGLMQALADHDYRGDFTYEIHNALSRMPRELRPGMLQQTVEIARWLIGRFQYYRDSRKPD